MTEATIISLRRYGAHRRVRQLRSLPPGLRTPARAAPALEAIVAYAWEPAAGDEPAEPARICRRLEEFVPPAPSGLGGQWGLVHWLYDNLVPEAWDSPTLFKPLLTDCLRDG
ncbi:MAG: hypothetical protein JSV45_08185 [Chromatiales bacterium]|nr:MAG: hypothetical protein JSV45_08185 [Chromatiales bacterium]